MGDIACGEISLLHGVLLATKNTNDMFLLLMVGGRPAKKPTPRAVLLRNGKTNAGIAN